MTGYLRQYNHYEMQRLERVWFEKYDYMIHLHAITDITID